ncbi:MAG: CDP-alcohol phosphatidyltransferase family protein [Phycisphaerae bacterium]|nr:CDP-alcohol phosphatidyltransferase family protein [Phycisphaerae bacterium]
MSDAVRRSLPNALTLLRLFVAAAFFTTLTLTIRMGPHDDRPFWGNTAVALFVVAAATDFLDGYLARRWQAVSVFGRIMDPFVDKVLILGAFIFLASPRFAIPVELEPDRFRMSTGVATWMVVVILARELLVTSIRGVIEAKGISFGAEAVGKWKMVLQCIAVPVALFVAVNEWLLNQPWARMTRDGIVWVTVIVTVWSAWAYIVKARVLLRDDHP